MEAGERDTYRSGIGSGGLLGDRRARVGRVRSPLQTGRSGAALRQQGWPLPQSKVRNLDLFVLSFFS